MNRPETQVTTGADALVESMLAHGIDTLFALPGAQIDHLFASLHDRSDRMRTVVARHEQGAGYMAFGAARSTGKPSAYAVVPGPGWLNSASSLLTAYGCYTPVMSIAGQIPSASIGRDFGELHEIPDQLGLAAGLTKRAERIDCADSASLQFAEAYRSMLSGTPRPVYLEMPPDIMGAPSSGATTPPLARPGSDLPPDDDIERAARMLIAADEPLIFVGGGAQESSRAVRRIAEFLQAPVGALRAGRGVMDERSYLSQPWPSMHEAWANSSVVLAIGTRLDFPLRMWGFDENQRFIWIDTDPDRPHKITEPAIALVGEASAVASRLADALEQSGARRDSRRRDLEGRKAAAMAEFDRRMAPQMAWLRAIRSALPDDGLFVDEVTQVGYASWMWFPTYAPRTYVSSGYQGNLGYGFPTAIGVKIANPDKPVIAISGDGGFQYGAGELATAVKHDVSLVVIVFNDGWFGNVRRIQRERYGGRIHGSDLVNPDYRMLAMSYGIFSERVAAADELEGAIARAFTAGGPALIEVRVGEMPSPWPTVVRSRNR